MTDPLYMFIRVATLRDGNHKEDLLAFIHASKTKNSAIGVIREFKRICNFRAV